MSDTRQRLLEEAERLVRGRGFAGFSYADLASVVGLRKASIHHHFPTKSDMAVALLASYDARYDEALTAITREEHVALARIERYAALYQGGVEKGLGCLCAAFAAELEVLPQELRTELDRFFRKHIDWLESVIVLGRADGSLRTDVDPASAARMILAMLEGALMMERAVAGPVGFRRGVAALIQCLRQPS